MTVKLGFVYDDGGRKAAGFRGDADDCFCRALSIAADIPYFEAYAAINYEAKLERRRKGWKTVGSSARSGVYRVTADKLLREFGFKWTPTMRVGTGCKVHLNADELPQGRIVARVSKHYVAVIDGVIRDTDDPSRDGRRCVYGYWTKEAT